VMCRDICLLCLDTGVAYLLTPDTTPSAPDDVDIAY
jgi:hypothetical protein